MTWYSIDAPPNSSIEVLQSAEPVTANSAFMHDTTINARVVHVRSSCSTNATPLALINAAMLPVCADASVLPSSSHRSARDAASTVLAAALVDSTSKMKCTHAGPAAARFVSWRSHNSAIVEDTSFSSVACCERVSCDWSRGSASSRVNVDAGSAPVSFEKRMHSKTMLCKQGKKQCKTKTQSTRCKHGACTCSSVVSHYCTSREQ